MSKTQPARGTRDFLPADVRKRNYVINIIREVYESYGFEPLETPSIENLETLTGKYGEEGSQLMFKVLKRGEKLQEELAEGKITSENQLSDLALRYDLTVPLARVVANYKNELPKFFKRYQIQPVWRADRPAKGRYREFYQCDVDAIGSSSMMVEAELCAAVSEILEKLGFDDFVIRINNRKVLSDIVKSAGILEANTTDALVALDKMDKIGSDGVQKELIERGIEKSAAELFIAVFEGFVGLEKVNENKNKIGFDAFNQAFLDRWKDGNDEESEKDTKLSKELQDTITLTGETSAKKYIKFDPSLARGLSYYTGAIFEVNVPDFAGSLAGGGRYDGLIGMFGKEQIPAVGFSIGLERILTVMEDRRMFEKLVAEGKLKDDSADVLVTIWNEETAGESLKLASELRKQNLRVLVYPETDKLGKQFKYADAIGVNYVCVLGETELAEDTVTLRNMKTGTQESLEIKELVKKIKNSG